MRYYNNSNKQRSKNRDPRIAWYLSSITEGKKNNEEEQMIREMWSKREAIYQAKQDHRLVVK